jgi:hypothetical protein
MHGQHLRTAHDAGKDDCLRRWDVMSYRTVMLIDSDSDIDININIAMVPPAASRA